MGKRLPHVVRRAGYLGRVFTLWWRAVLVVFGLIAAYDTIVSQFVPDKQANNLPRVSDVLGAGIGWELWAVVGFALLAGAALEGGYRVWHEDRDTELETSDQPAVPDLAEALKVTASQIVEHKTETADGVIFTIKQMAITNRSTVPVSLDVRLEFVLSERGTLSTLPSIGVVQIERVVKSLSLPEPRLAFPIDLAPQTSIKGHAVFAFTGFAAPVLDGAIVTSAALVFRDRLTNSNYRHPVSDRYHLDAFA